MSEVSASGDRVKVFGGFSPGVPLRGDRPAMKLHRYAVKSGNVHTFGVKGEYSHDAVKDDFICREGRGTV